MRLAVPFVLLLAWAVLVELHVQHGDFETPSGISCLWYHLRSNESELSMGIACWCHTAVEERQNYGCSYFTNVESCDKDSDDFFEKMVKKLKGMNKIF